MGGHRSNPVVAVLLTLVCVSACAAYTQGDPEFRGIWVDAWGAGYMSQSQVDQLLGVVGDPNSKGDIRNANCNAVIVQVRRRADVCYESHMGEPYMTGLSPANFNALQAICAAAHDTTGGKKRIEVHAWIVTFATASGVAGPVYYQHNNPADPDNYWMTLDDAGNETSDKAFDPGHPKCEEYIVNVCMDIVNNNDVDGIHFDYIRFTGDNQGYNPTSIARYNARYGLSGQPEPDDELFQQWRRDQVTAVVRQVYARVQASKPHVKVSGSFVTWNPSAAASTREAFMATRPYYQVYSDWDSWIQEGIVDCAMPMTYYNWATYPNDYTRWINFEKDRKFNRHMYIGVGLGSNSLANAIRELNMTRDPSPSNNYADGFAGYSYGSPYSGGTWSGFAPTFVSQVANSMVDIPAMSWKSNPNKGHISGTVTHVPIVSWADGATVSISGPENRTMVCDGTGFYAFIDLTPGTYTVTASQDGCVTQQKVVNVAIGEVTGNMYVTDFALITAPVITNVRPLAMTTTTATIGWDTDQVSSSQVEYGPTTSYGMVSPLDPAQVTAHSVALAGLLPNKLYHYRVISANENGTRVSGDYTFTTGSFSLTLIPNPAAGGSCSGGGWYPAGTSVSAHAAVNPGYFLVSWSTDPDGTDVVSTDNPYAFNTPQSNVTLYANFQSSVADIIIESEVGGLHHEWYTEVGLAHSTAKSSAPGVTPGIGSRYGSITETTNKEASYLPAIPISGWYQVSVTWGTSSSGGTSIKHTVTHRDGQYTVTYNQSSSGNLQNKWNVIGTFPFAAGASGACGQLRQYVTATQSGRRIMADAAKWVYVGPFKVTKPSPANGSTNVPPTGTILSWTPGGTTLSYDVYLGTSTASLTKVSGAQTGTSYAPEALAGSTTYYWRVDANCLGKTTTGDVWNFTTAALPPAISDLQISNITVGSATISWTTDTPATTQVHYGTSPAYGQSTAKDTNLTTSHIVNLTGLTPNTVYHFCAESASAAGLLGRSEDRTFLTPANAPEIIVDNLEGVYTGTWNPLADAGGWPTSASQYVYADNTKSTTTATFKWEPNVSVAGRYNVYCWYKSGSDRTASARYTIVYTGGQMSVVVVNQTANGSQWYKIADALQFDAGSTGYVQLTNKTGENDGTKKVVADAIRLEYAENDTTPPTPPTNLAATAVSESQIDLTWSPSTDDRVVLGYRVYRDAQILALTASTSYSDTGLDANSRHVYTVTAYDAKFNESAPSNQAARFTFARPVLPQHVACNKAANTWYNTTAFTFTNDGLGSGKLANYRFAWDHSPTHAWTDSETVWATPSVIVNAASSSDGWYFHVKGYNGDGVPCGAVDMGPYLCDTQPPAAPTDLTAAAAGTSQIDVSWTASADNIGVTGYRIYRDSQLLTASAPLAYSDTGLVANKRYTYQVAAVDAAGNESARSDSASRYTLGRPVLPAHITCNRNTNTPYPTPGFTFTNDGFGTGKLACYRYVWDNSSTHAWTGGEPQWNSTQMTLNASSTAPWYLHLRGFNGDDVACGDLDRGPYYCGVPYDRICDGMNNPDGTQVIFNLFKQITAVFENRFYIQEPDRTRGIRVEGQTTRSVGELVRLSGTLATLAGERCLTAVQELGAAPGSEPRPMLVRASLLGGRAPDPYTLGIAGAATPYNVGLLVRVVGRVASQTSGSFMLDDGSGAIVKVYSNKTVANGSMVGATGVCGIESGAPVILTRQQSDVMIY